MSHAYSRNYVHLTFSTLDRRKAIVPQLQTRLWAYLEGIAREYGLETLAIGGMADHVHLLLHIPPRHSVANVVRTLKANSSKWMNETGHLFAWQEGYGAFSVSPSSVADVKKYIEQQAEHHASRTFEEEFTSLLKKCGVEYTPEHVFG